MKKFCVFSGFLGSGKTTTMMALTKYFSALNGKAAMISNDIANQNLADNRLAVLAGCNASELTGNCICYQTENLVDTLDRLFDGEDCELVISDIPGFGVGALDHVYHTLQRRYTGRYELAPFTVLTEPDVLRKLRDGSGGDLGYILNAQLMEADLIVLNKRELLSEEEITESLRWLKENYPQAEVLAISALRGEGLEELSRTLINGKASLRLPDIGYGGAEFARAMGGISEYYIQYFAQVCCDSFDGSAYLLDMASAVSEALKAGGYDMPHLKLLAWDSEGDYGKADLLGVSRDVELAKAFTKPCTELSVMLNGSAVCPADKLERIMEEALERASEKHNLTLMLFKKDCLPMGG